MNTFPCAVGVLVGGKSSRFGRPKALELLPNGKSVIEHVVEVAAAVFDEVVLLGHGFDLPPALRGYRQLEDFEKGAGPITGLHSLLAYTKDRWALLLACDLPLLHGNLFHPLILAAIERPKCNAIAYATGLSRRPAYTCCTLYHPEILPDVEQAVDREEFRLQSILAGSQTQLIQPSAEQLRLLLDMNTPDDKSRLLGD